MCDFHGFAIYCYTGTSLTKLNNLIPVCSHTPSSPEQSGAARNRRGFYASTQLELGIMMGLVPSLHPPICLCLPGVTKRPIWGLLWPCHTSLSVPCTIHCATNGLELNSYFNNAFSFVPEPFIRTISMSSATGEWCLILLKYICLSHENGTIDAH